MMPILSSIVAQQVAILTSYGATNGDKVGNLGVQGYLENSHTIHSNMLL